MRVTRFNNQKNLTELVEQLFKVGKTPGTRAAALNALADANPGIDLRAGRLAERLEPGTLLVVPEVEGATHTKRSKDLSDEAAAALLSRAKVVIADGNRALEDSSDQAVAEIKSRIATLESQEMRQAARGDPAVEKRLNLLNEAGHQSVERLSEQRSREQTALQEAEATVATLVEQLWAGH